MAQSIKPIISEKTVFLAENNNAYTFAVPLSMNKIAAAKEVEKLFNVKVKSVNALVRPGKKVFWGRSRTSGQRSAKKVMIFKLAEGQKIDAFTQ